MSALTGLALAACGATGVALLADVTPAPFDHDAATLMYAAHELFATCLLYTSRCV